MDPLGNDLLHFRSHLIKVSTKKAPPKIPNPDCWCHTVGGRNLAPVEIHKRDEVPTSTGEFTGFLNHQQYVSSLEGITSHP